MKLEVHAASWFAFDELAAFETGAGADEGDQVRGVHRAPAVLGRLDQLERHGQPRRPRPWPLSDLGPVPDRGEGRLDRAGGAQMHPVPGGIVVEREQLIHVVGDLRGGRGELRPVDGTEGLHRGQGVLLVFSTPDLRQGLLRPRVRGLRQRGQHVRRLVEPAAALPSLGEHLAQPVPESQRPVPDGQHRGAHPAPRAIAQQVGPPATPPTRDSHRPGQSALCGHQRARRS
jgi:hypothetical protein